MLALQRSAGNAAVNRLLREVAPPPAGGGTATSEVLVADDAEPGQGQVRMGDFLDTLEPRLCDLAERKLGSRAIGCPWITHWVAYYRERSLSEVAEAVKRYAPDAGPVRSADELMEAVCARVEDGITAWQADATVAFKLRDDAPAPAVEAAEVLGRLGPGRDLDGTVRARMGAALGADFGGVRVHDDPEASRVTHQLGAHALAVGEHIAFAPNRYEPGTPVGDALIAHELAHVMQQRGEPSVSRTAALEADADHAATGALDALYGGPAAARGVRPALRAGLRLQRCGPDKSSAATKAGPSATPAPPAPAAPPPLFAAAAASQPAAHGALDAYKKLAPADRRKAFDQAFKAGTLAPALKALGAEEASGVYREEVRELLMWVQEEATHAYSGMDDAKMADVEAKWVYAKNQAAAAAAKGGGAVTDVEVETERKKQEQAKSYYKPMAKTTYDALDPKKRAEWDADAKKAIDALVAYATAKRPELKITAANLVWDPNAIDKNAPGALAQGRGPGTATVGFVFVTIVKVDPAYALSTVVHELWGHPEHDAPGGNYSLRLFQLAGPKIPGYVQDPTAEGASYNYHESEIYSLMRELPYWTKVSAKNAKWESLNYDPRGGIGSQLDDIMAEWEPKLAAAIVHGLYKRFEVDPRLEPMALAGFSNEIKTKFPAEHAAIVK